MPEHALKEWAVTVAALARGAQVVVLRKGGIGEKRFELPHPRFFLFPTYEHQRPELVKPAARAEYADELRRAEDPTRLPLPVYAELHAAHPVTDQAALRAVDPLHNLTLDYAAERLRWRRTQPLWAAVLRAWTLESPPVLDVLPEHGGCVSWVDLPDGMAPGHLRPALDDHDFAEAASAVEAALAVAPTR